MKKYTYRAKTKLLFVIIILHIINFADVSTFFFFKCPKLKMLVFKLKDIFLHICVFLPPFRRRQRLTTGEKIKCNSTEKSEEIRIRRSI